MSKDNNPSNDAVKKAEQAREIDRKARADCEEIARRAEGRLPEAADFIVQRIVSVPWPS